MDEHTNAPKLTFRTVDGHRWKDFERLFASRGGPNSCWCMLWRANAQEGRRRDGASRKRAMAARIKAGTMVGLLGYVGREPVAWCSIAPRSTYRRLVSDASDDGGVWSIACFYVLRKLRGVGLTRQIIAAAIEHARIHGADIVEAYPVDGDSPSYRFMGFVPMFEEAGFQETGREGLRRHVMRLHLSQVD